MEDQVAAAGRLVGQGEVHLEAGRHVGARGVDVDERDGDAGDAGEQPGHAAAHGPGPDHRHPVTDQRPGVPERVHRRLDDPGEHRARDRHVVGHDGDGGRRHDVRRLVGVQAEDGAPAEVRLGRPRPGPR